MFSELFKSGDSMNGHEFTKISPDTKCAEAVRIMSFNLRCTDVNGTPADKRYPLAVQEINLTHPDSFGVQEGTPKWMEQLTNNLPEYDHTGIDRDKGLEDGPGEYNAVFWLKAKYKLVKSGTFWLSDTPGVPSYGEGAACRRVCTWAVLENRLTHEVYVHVNSHLDHVSEPARVFGAQKIIEFINADFDGMHVVFTADMNTSENGDAYKTMTNVLSDARFSAEKSEPFGTFHAVSPETHEDLYIDFILCSGGIRVGTYKTITAGIDNRFVSDHFPIYADIYM